MPEDRMVELALLVRRRRAVAGSTTAISRASLVMAAAERVAEAQRQALSARAA